MSEKNRVPLLTQSGFHDHYPVFKWLFHWEYIQHFQTNPYGHGGDPPIFVQNVLSIFCFRRFGIESLWRVFDRSFQKLLFSFAEKKKTWCFRVSSYVMISNKSGRFIISNHVTSMNPPPLPLPIWLMVHLPLCKIWKSVGIIIPNIWKNVPNHQPAIVFRCSGYIISIRIFFLYHLTTLLRHGWWKTDFPVDCDHPQWILDGITASQPSFITDIHVNIPIFWWLQPPSDERIIYMELS